jgi:ABC-type maltose transport systems, permease component
VHKLSLWGHVWRHLFIWAALAFTFFPIVWVVSASFDGTNTLVQQSVVPIAPTLDNYRMLAQEPRYPFFTWMWNSIKVSAPTLSFPCSCALWRRTRFRGSASAGGGPACSR